MQLPYPAPLPSWTRYGHPCLTSRPLLTVHPQQYASVPRLFPVDLSARQVFAGTGDVFQPPSTTAGDALSDRAKNDIESVGDEIVAFAAGGDGGAACKSTPRRRVRYPLEGNPMAAVDDGGTSYVAFSRSGLLSDVGFARVSLAADDAMEEYHPAYRPSQPVPHVCDEDGQVLQLVATNRDANSSESGLIAARVRDAVYLGRFRQSSDEFNWRDRFAMESSCSVCINEVSMNEVATLDACALSVFDLEYGHAVAAPMELQPLHRSSLFRWLRYGSHPRTLLLANAAGVGHVDLRVGLAADEDFIVLEPREDWNLCKQDTGICFFDMHPRQPFQSVLMTSSLLCVMDARMLQQPLLEWNVNCSEPYLSGAVAALDADEAQRQECDIVIALASAPASDLWVLHATHCSDSATDMLTPSADCLPMRTHASKRPRLLWSDMPLEQLDRFPERHETRGVALVPFPKEKRVALLQYSVNGGTIAQLLGCDRFQDDAYMFAVPEKDEEEGSAGLLDEIDSFVSIYNARDVAALEPLVNSEDPEALRKTRALFEGDLKPCWEMQQAGSRLDARDALHLLKRIDQKHDDGRGPLSNMHAPRGFCSDLMEKELESG